MKTGNGYQIGGFYVINVIRGKEAKTLLVLNIFC